MKIDAHNHFWRYNETETSWLSDAGLKCIQKDFLPNDFLPILVENGLEGSIAVQADQSEAETLFLLDLAKKNRFIKAVVGWVDLCSDSIDNRLDFYKQFKVLKGFRHILQGEEPEFMLEKNFQNGMAQLQKYNFTYDVLVYPHQLDAVKILVAKNPNQAFVIDHLAKPYIKNNLIADWKKDIQELANFDNVWIKISGMTTEADWVKWKTCEFTPYLDVVTNVFGTKKVIYGSDWPVCLLAASYYQQLCIVQEYFSKFTRTEQQDFFGRNAQQFYTISNEN